MKRDVEAVRLEGRVRPHFVVLNARESLLRRHEAAWRVYTTQRPLYAVRKQGVVLAGVYEWR